MYRTAVLVHTRGLDSTLSRKQRWPCFPTYRWERVLCEFFLTLSLRSLCLRHLTCTNCSVGWAKGAEFLQGRCCNKGAARRRRRWLQGAWLMRGKERIALQQKKEGRGNDATVLQSHFQVRGGGAKHLSSACDSTPLAKGPLLQLSVARRHAIFADPTVGAKSMPARGGK